jgi:hypothetical protein
MRELEKGDEIKALVVVATPNVKRRIQSPKHNPIVYMKRWYFQVWDNWSLKKDINLQCVRGVM